VFYGIPIVHPNSILVVTINGTGVFLEVIYVTMFVIYCANDTRVSKDL
jgi:solute carrier family 50 protein (sugar transporter)